MKRDHGFSLVELMVSVSILTVISGLGYVAATTSAQSVNVSQTKGMLQSELRNLLLEMTQEVELASQKTDTSLPQSPATGTGVNAIDVLSTGDVMATGEKIGDLRFQIPANDAASVWSTPILYRFENEDTNANGKLDTGEDADADKMLARRLVRIQNGVKKTIGGANNIVPSKDTSGNVVPTFAMNTANNVLTITLSAEKALNSRRKDKVRVTLSTQVFILNVPPSKG